MSKIDPKTPSAPQTAPDTTPDAATNATPDAASPPAKDTLQTTSTSSPPLSANKDPAPTDGAFSAPTVSDKTSTPEDTRLFTIGKGRISRDDIKRTIQIIQDMEAIIIKTMTSRLGQQNIPGGAPRQNPAPRIKRTITGPDGKPRTIDFRGKQDQIDSAKDGTFSKDSRLKLLALAQSLPPHTNLDDLDTRAGDFQTECIALLSEPGTDIYAIKQLLPIKESGALVPSDPNSNQKPDATYTPITSKMLLDQAIAIGALKKDE
jgi:hypothetical protein